MRYHVSLNASMARQCAKCFQQCFSVESIVIRSVNTVISIFVIDRLYKGDFTFSNLDQVGTKIVECSKEW